MSIVFSLQLAWAFPKSCYKSVNDMLGKTDAVMLCLHDMFVGYVLPMLFCSSKVRKAMPVYISHVCSVHIQRLTKSYALPAWM